MMELKRSEEFTKRVNKARIDAASRATRDLLNTIRDAGGVRADVMIGVVDVAMAIIAVVFEPDEFEQAHYTLQAQLRDRLITLAHDIENGLFTRSTDLSGEDLNRNGGNA
jgi:hypothetical protein